MRKTTTLALLATGRRRPGLRLRRRRQRERLQQRHKAGSSSGDEGGAKGEDKPAKTAKIGQPARDGKFEFTVKSSKCGVARSATTCSARRRRASSAWSRST